MSDATRRAIFSSWSWRARLALVIALVIVVGLLVFWPLFNRLTGVWNARGFEEFRLPNRTDMPVAIAAARDGTVWFTLESSDTIGRLQNGRVEKIPTGGQSLEPLGLAVDSGGSAWYTEAAKQRISRAERPQRTGLVEASRRRPPKFFARRLSDHPSATRVGTWSRRLSRFNLRIFLEAGSGSPAVSFG